MEFINQLKETIEDLSNMTDTEFMKYIEKFVKYKIPAKHKADLLLFLHIAYLMAKEKKL